MNAHNYSFTSVDGEPLVLSTFSGNSVLLVNTASECGFTPQYVQLQKLWQAYRDRGLVVLGVPSNDFGAQEPGSEAEIKAFCSANYGVDFPMTSKVNVVGEHAHPLFKAIHEEFESAADPAWNFHKFLIGLDGDLVEIWPSRVEPLSKEVVAAVEGLLVR